MDHFKWWREALETGRPIDIEVGRPRAGFYRNKFVGKDDTAFRWEAIAIWYEAVDNGEGDMVDQIQVDRQFGRLPRDLAEADDLFARIARNPIPEKLYYDVTEAGAAWPDDLPYNDTQNSQDLPPHELLKSEIEEHERSALKLIATFKGGVPATQEQADLLANYKIKLTALKGKAKKDREALVRPHLDAQRDINATWMPLEKLADAATAKLSPPLTAWLKAEQDRLDAERRAREAEEKAERDRLAQIERDRERAQLEAEAEALAAGKPLDQVLDERPAAPPPAMPERRPVQETIPTRARVGTRGTAALRTYKVNKIQDWKACADYFVSMQTPAPALVECIQTLVNKCVAAGVTPPGVAQVEEQKA